MKLVTFSTGTAVKIGTLTGDSITTLPYPDMLAAIAAGPAAIAAATHLPGSAATQPLSEAKLLAPIPRPPRIFCIGLNYASHAAESQMKVQAVPTVFMKLSSSVTGPDTDVILPVQQHAAGLRGRTRRRHRQTRLPHRRRRLGSPRLRLHHRQRRQRP